MFNFEVLDEVPKATLPGQVPIANGQIAQTSDSLLHLLNLNVVVDPRPNQNDEEGAVQDPTFKTDMDSFNN